MIATTAPWQVGRKDGQKQSAIDHMRQQPLQKGDCVSFSVVEQTGSDRGRGRDSSGGGGGKKSVAMRVFKLPKDSVQRQVTLQTKVKGHISSIDSPNDDDDSTDPSSSGGGGYLRKPVPVYYVSVPLTSFVSRPLFEILSEFAKSECVGAKRTPVSKVIAKVSTGSRSHKGAARRGVGLTKSVENGVLKLGISSAEWELTKEYARALGLTCTLVPAGGKNGGDAGAAKLVVERSEGVDGSDDSEGAVVSSTSEDGEAQETDWPELVHNVVLKLPRSFGLGSQPPVIGDSVLLDVVVDKITMVMDVENVQRLNEDGSVFVDHDASAMEEAMPADTNERTSERTGAEEMLGVVACIKKDGGFGFIQCATKAMRLFFSVKPSSFVDNSSLSTLKAGESVAFVATKSNQGWCATRIRQLFENESNGNAEGQLALEACDTPDVTMEVQRVRGVVRSELNRSVILQNSRSDCVDALRIQASQMPPKLMGQVVIGDVDTKAVAAATATAAAVSSSFAYSNKVDWRRETELINKVRDFVNSSNADTTADGEADAAPEGAESVVADVVELEVASADEERVVRKAARKNGGVLVGKHETRLVLARSKEVLSAHLAALVVTPTKAGGDHIEEVADEVPTGTAETAAKGEARDEVSGKADDRQQQQQQHQRPYFFTSYDIVGKEIAERGLFVGEQVEFTVAVNAATKTRRALEVKLLGDVGTKRTGVVDAAPYGGRFGFLRTDVPEVEEARDGEGGDPSAAATAAGASPGVQQTKLAAMSRGQTVKFDVSEVVRNVRLNQGDRVEYYVVTDRNTKKNKAVSVKLVKRMEGKNSSGGGGGGGGVNSSKAEGTGGRKVINRALMEKFRASQEQVAIPKFVQAKGPDGTNGFAPGRGRAVPSELRPTAKEFTPTFAGGGQVPSFTSAQGISLESD
jgi:cold shock CspA family protein